jgi:hypothetical protein
VCNTTSGVCEPCGAAGQPCCTDRRCTAPGTACHVPEEPDPQNPPLCRTCGAPGQRCCVKRTCLAGTFCTGPDVGICLRGP